MLKLNRTRKGTNKIRGEINMKELSVNSSVHLDGEFGVTNKVKSALHEASQKFIYIGFLLDEVNNMQYYLEKGYSDIYEYCLVELGFERSSTNNFIRVYRNFGECMSLKEPYKLYSYSQLVEMCSLKSSQLLQVKPEMTVKEIRNLKKTLSTGNITYTVDTSSPVQTSGQSTVACVLNNFWVDVPADIFNSFLDFFVGKNKPPKNCRSYDVSITVHKDN